jgi:hypothetical protein
MTILTTSQNRRHESTSRLQALEASADRLEIIAKDIERLQGTAIFERAAPHAGCLRLPGMPWLSAQPRPERLGGV